jgi:hypothetical protein
MLPAPIRNLEMNARTTRRLWFAGIWLLLPWTLPVYMDAFVPAVRYVLLAGVASSIAVVEGSAGPVRLIILLFAGWGLITTLLSAFLAWLISTGLARISPRTATWVTLVCLVVGFAIAVAFEPYRTPFARAATGGLFQVLS